MQPENYLVLACILFLLVVLYRGMFRPMIAFFVVIVVLTIAKVLSPEDVLHGFANEQLSVIILLLIFSDVIKKSGLLDEFFNKITSGVTSEKSFTFRILSIIAVLSGFFNNTPLVAISMPYVNEWSRKNGIPVSKILMPLSYAAILGGCATLVGTSTNLIVNGMYIESGFESLSVIDFAYVGVPMIFIGLSYLVVVSSKLLPKIDSAMDSFQDSPRSYFVETSIEEGSRLVGKSVEQAKLRDLKGLFLVEIIRGERIIAPVAPTNKLMASDKLIFTGETSAIEDLRSLGLTLPNTDQAIGSGKAEVKEVVISANSSLNNQKIKESDFRGKYDGAIVAVHRNGERLSGKVGDIVLKAGDALLVIAGKDFLKRVRGNQAFYMLSTNPPSVKKIHGQIVLLGVMSGIILSAFNLVPLFDSLLGLLAIVFVFKMDSVAEIRKGIDFDLIAILALGLALGKAIINTGTSDYVAEGMLKVLAPMGPIGILAGVFLITNILSSYMTNKAAIAVVFPVAYSLAHITGMDFKPLVLIVAYGAAASFITPIGFQTNLMVYGPGGYTFKDYFKNGIGLTLIYMLASVSILAVVYKLI